MGASLSRRVTLQAPPTPASPVSGAPRPLPPRGEEKICCDFNDNSPPLLGEGDREAVEGAAATRLFVFKLAR